MWKKYRYYENVEIFKKHKLNLQKQKNTVIEI